MMDFFKMLTENCFPKDTLRFYTKGKKKKINLMIFFLISFSMKTQNESISESPS